MKIFYVSADLEINTSVHTEKLELLCERVNSPLQQEGD